MPPYLSKKQKVALVVALTLCLKPRTRRTEKKRVWSRLQNLKKEQVYQMSIIRELDNQDFRRYMRIESDSFDLLLKLVRPLIKKQDTLMRQAVSPENRLLATLKYLVLGKDYTDLAFSCGMSVQLMSQVVPETCEAICKVLKNYMKVPETENEWLKIAEQYQEKWQFNNCVGCMAARHILVVRPKEYSPQYQNYSDSYSVLLFAIVNADYEFLYVDTGTPGSLSAGPILESTKFYEKLCEDELNLPEASVLPNSNWSAPYVFLGDSGFGLDKYILEPYPNQNITQKASIFNYRLQRATRVTENVFGVLASRFRVFQKNILVDIRSRPQYSWEKARQMMILVDIQNVKKIIMACCYLHNYLIKKSPNYITSACVDHEDVDGTIQEGLWREQDALLPLQKFDGESRDCPIVKNVFTEYFNGTSRVEVQNEMLYVLPFESI